MNKKILPKTKTGSEISLEPNKDTWDLRFDHSLEAQEIEAWNQKDIEAEFDTDINIEFKEAKDITEIDIFCDKPDDCESHKQYGECCRCIRTNFDSPNAYKHWQNSIKNLMEKEAKHFVRKHKI
jgi:hypothetical protein